MTIQAYRWNEADPEIKKVTKKNVGETVYFLEGDHYLNSIGVLIAWGINDCIIEAVIYGNVARYTVVTNNVFISFDDAMFVATKIHEAERDAKAKEEQEQKTRIRIKALDAIADKYIEEQKAEEVFLASASERAAKKESMVEPMPPSNVDFL